MSQDVDKRPVKRVKKHSKDGEKLKKQKQVLERAPGASAPAVADNGQCKFARVLGSPDYQTREQGLQALTRWLTCKSSIPELDMLKIWKGLFFCFWHSDKVPVQTDLAERLAAILPRMQRDTGLLYMRTFVATLRREWFTIDRLRLDKFMLLVRKFVERMLATIAASNWDTSLAEDYASLLQDGLLLPPDNKPAASLTYHISDLFISSLISAAAASKPPPRNALLALLQPFANALQRSNEHVLLGRVREGVFGELAREVASPSEGAPLAALPALELSEQLFEMGAAEGIKARNREALYGASQDLQRAAGKRRKLEGSFAAGSSEAAAVQLGQQQATNGITAGQEKGAEAQNGAATGDKFAKKKKRKQPAAEAAAAVAVLAGEPGFAAAEPASTQHKNQKQQAANAAEGDAVSVAAVLTNGDAGGLHAAMKRQKRAKGDAALLGGRADALAAPQHDGNAGETTPSQHRQQQGVLPGGPSSSKKQHMAHGTPGAGLEQQEQHTAATPATSSKKKKKRSSMQDVAAEQERLATPSTVTGDQMAPASQKKPRPHASSSAAAEAGPSSSTPAGGKAAAAQRTPRATAQPTAQAGVAVTPGPSSAKPSKKRRQGDDAAGAPDSTEAAAAAGTANGTPSTPAGPRIRSTGIVLATPQAANAQPAATAPASAQHKKQPGANGLPPAGSRSAPPKSSRGEAVQEDAAARGAATAVKRGVTFDMKRNIYFQVGAPVPLPDVRTPPRAKPKGSALKQSQALAKDSMRHKPPASAPAKTAQAKAASAAPFLANVAGQQSRRPPLTPKTAPRPRAASFF